MLQLFSAAAMIAVRDEYRTHGSLVDHYKTRTLLGVLLLSNKNPRGVYEDKDEDDIKLIIKLGIGADVLRQTRNQITRKDT